ncbi:urease accessory protein UreD [Minwuia sp.]|uniref:urease accessory protein UreD n=1 Tax=Minwuia sp. TaxID=2493630 RepID=UPI003A94BED4
MHDRGRPVPKSVTHPADLDLVFAAGPDGTWLKRRRASYPYALTGIYPPRKRGLTVMPQSVSGGLFGGENMIERVRANGGAIARVHDQGARTCHASREHGPARVSRILRGETGAVLNWYGQPSVLLPGSETELRTEISVSADACVICSEVFGYHQPHSEPARAARLRSHMRILRDGAGVVAENAADIALSPRSPGWFATLILVLNDPARATDVLSGLDDETVPEGLALGIDRLPGEAGLIVMATGDHAGTLTGHVHRLQSFMERRTVQAQIGG